MLLAPRCGGRTRRGTPCGNPAVTGKRRCRIHGGKGSKGRSYRREFSDYSKANLERDKQITAEIKNLGKVIRTLQREGTQRAVISDLETIRRALNQITQKKQTDLAASYVASPTDLVGNQGGTRMSASGRSYPFRDYASVEMVRDRARGTMLGLAVGEAVGLTVQGWPRDTYRHISDMLGGGRLDVKPGQWASDTATALALMDSLAWNRFFDETDLMDRFLEWEEEGAYSCTKDCLGICKTTREALARYRETDDPIAGDLAPDNLSNGSLVRVAPVAIRYWNSPAELHDVATRQSRTTHASAFAVEACFIFARVLADAIGGAPREKVLGRRYLPHLDSTQPIMAGSWKTKRRSDIRSTDNVLNSLEAALWCVDKTETFEEAVLLAANLGEDAGTTAALAGQLAGALHGASCIPGSWIERLAWHDLIVERADELLEQSTPKANRR
jgi:ADP-ribosylglycohydrolase